MRLLLAYRHLLHYALLSHLINLLKFIILFISIYFVHCGKVCSERKSVILCVLKCHLSRLLLKCLNTWKGRPVSTLSIDQHAIKVTYFLWYWYQEGSYDCTTSMPQAAGMLLDFKYHHKPQLHLGDALNRDAKKSMRKPHRWSAKD